MQYNSKRESLTIPEYGRHVQRMVEHIITVEDRAVRQQLAEGMVNLMLSMGTQERKTQEYSDKTWRHLLKIADYKLDVDVPEGISLERPVEVDFQNVRPHYPSPVKRYRHYGQYIQDLIEKALAMEEGEKKQEFVRIIGSYMKTAYKQWNRDHYINDESVLEDIKIITKGQLSLSEDASFDYLKNAQGRPNTDQKRGKSRSGSNYGKKSNKHKQYKKRKTTY